MPSDTSGHVDGRLLYTVTCAMNATPCLGTLKHNTWGRARNSVKLQAVQEAWVYLQNVALNDFDLFVVLTIHKYYVLLCRPD